jgi:hypothetical protein
MEEIFHEGNAVYGKHVGIFLFFVPYKVNIPMYAGGFKQVQYKEYICWIQVKSHISDQTSLRICNSIHTLDDDVGAAFLYNHTYSMQLECPTGFQSS